MATGPGPESLERGARLHPGRVADLVQAGREPLVANVHALRVSLRYLLLTPTKFM